MAENASDVIENETVGNESTEKHPVLARRQSRVQRGEFDLEECKISVQKFNQDNNELNTEISHMRSITKGQANRINDLREQFEDARERIQKLLRSRTTIERDVKVEEGIFQDIE